MEVEKLSADQQRIYWEVKEWFPRASRVQLINHITQGMDSEKLINLCSEGGVVNDDDENGIMDNDLALALRLSKQEAEFEGLLDPLSLHGSEYDDEVVVRHLQFEQPVVWAGAAAAAAAPAFPLDPFELADNPQTSRSPAKKLRKKAETAEVAAAAAPDVIYEVCSGCHRTRFGSTRCHWPINPRIGDTKEKDENAHLWCAGCIRIRFLMERMSVTSRVAMACPTLGCRREIHQDRLVADALIHPALVQWMMGNTDVTVGEARKTRIVKEIRRKMEEEPVVEELERERLNTIIDHMDHDKFALLADELLLVDLTWILEHIDSGTIETIIELHLIEEKIPRRKKRRIDKRGITNLVEDRLKLETTFECSICCEESAKLLAVPCVLTKRASVLFQQHLFCGSCIRGHASASIEQPTIVSAGLGLKCMHPGCEGILIHSHIDPFLDSGCRTMLEEKLAAAALAAANVNVERCQRCPFAAIVDVPFDFQQTFACMRCGFEYCRNCNREWNARHEGKTCEELNPEFIRRKVENALSDGAVGVLQRCPKCNTAFEKNGGCDHMTCKCGHQFQYGGVRALSAQQRQTIIQQFKREADGDEAAVEAIEKLK